MTSIGQWEMAQTCAKLESNAVVVGIDVSKDHLDAAQYPSGDLIQTSNDTKGLRTLLRWIGRQRAVHVVFEATGSFHRQLESYLAKASISFSRINPQHARKFAEATGKWTCNGFVPVCARTFRSVRWHFHMGRETHAG